MRAAREEKRRARSPSCVCANVVRMIEMIEVIKMVNVFRMIEVIKMINVFRIRIIESVIIHGS